MLENNPNPFVSIIIPAKNEAESLDLLLPKIKEKHKEYEILVIDDGSEDNTQECAKKHNVRVISHPCSLGNGAAIKTGARNAKGHTFIFMDADGQHQVEDIKRLIDCYNKGYDMVVGQRSRNSQASFGRYVANSFGNKFASLIVGNKIKDLTSGFRIVNAKKFKEFLHLLPNGFSSPSTITMAFFRMGYTIYYLPIKVNKRKGKSHLRPFTECIRFLLIIFKITTLYSPIKIFFPLAVLSFFLGIINYAYTFITHGRFTNMSAVLLSTAIIIFLIGLISEQITILMYQIKERYENSD